MRQMLVLIALCGSDGSAVTVVRGTNAGLSEPGGGTGGHYSTPYL